MGESKGLSVGYTKRSVCCVQCQCEVRSDEVFNRVTKVLSVKQ